MIIHTYIKHVCLFVVFLIVGSCMNLRGQTMWKQPTSEFTRKIKLRIIDDGDQRSYRRSLHLNRRRGVYQFAGRVRRLTAKGSSRKVRWPYECLGYKTQVADLKALPHKGSVYIIRLIPEVKRLAEVVISSERQSATVNAVSNKLSSASIDQSLGKSLASLLEQVSGVSSIQTGAHRSKTRNSGNARKSYLIINNGATNRPAVGSRPCSGSGYEQQRLYSGGERSRRRTLRFGKPWEESS